MVMVLVRGRGLCERKTPAESVGCRDRLHRDRILKEAAFLHEAFAECWDGKERLTADCLLLVSRKPRPPRARVCGYLRAEPTGSRWWKAEEDWVLLKLLPDGPSPVPH